MEKTDLKREEGRGNERGRRSEEGPKPSQPAGGAAAGARTSESGRNRPVQRCYGSAHSRSGNFCLPGPAPAGRLPERPRGGQARLARKAAESGGANRRGPPEGGSQKRRAARPRGAEPAASVRWSKPPWQSSNARQTISLGRVAALSMIDITRVVVSLKRAATAGVFPPRFAGAPPDRRNVGRASRRSKAIRSGQPYCS